MTTLPVNSLADPIDLGWLSSKVPGFDNQLYSQVGFLGQIEATSSWTDYYDFDYPIGLKSVRMWLQLPNASGDEEIFVAISPIQGVTGNVYTMGSASGVFAGALPAGTHNTFDSFTFNVNPGNPGKAVFSLSGFDKVGASSNAYGSPHYNLFVAVEYELPPASTNPTLTVHNVSASRGQQLALSSLVSILDPNSAGYRVLELWDSNGTATGGQFVVNNVAQGGNRQIDVGPANVANTTFSVGTAGGTDTLWARLLLNDGTLTAWQQFTVTAPVDRVPVVTAANKTATHGQIYSMSSLFSASDPDSDPITKYTLFNNGTGGAHFVVNGVNQAAGQDIVVTAAQLAQTTYQSGSGTDTIWVKAYDGAVWSNWSNGFTVTAPANRAPLVTVSNKSATHNQSFSASTLFSASDPDTDPITRYAFWNSGTGGGHFVVNGVAQNANQQIEITAAQLAQTTYLSGSGSDTLWVQAYDGISWSGWSSGFTVTAPINRAPVISVANKSATHNQSFAASSLFSARDPDTDTITKYSLWNDGTGGGHFVVNGVNQASSQEIAVTAAQLAQTTYQSGSGADTLWVKAYDGTAWSNWSNGFTVTAPINRAPLVSVSNKSVSHNQSFAASSLFIASDPDTDTITKYAFWNNGTGGAHFALNGATQGTNQLIEITAAQLAQLSYQSGSGTDTLWVQAYDGMAWSGWSTGFSVTAPTDAAPVITVTSFATANGQSFGASSLFYATDPEGDAIKQYSLWNSGAGGGRFVINGVVQAVNQEIVVTAAQLAQTTYLPGSGTDTVWVRASDGSAWSNWSSPFTVSTPVVSGPSYKLVSATINGTPANGINSNPSISSDGRYVAFDSSATNLVTGAPINQVYLKDLQTGNISYIGTSSTGVAANFAVQFPYIVPTGQPGAPLVSFISFASNLVSGAGGSGYDEIFLKNTQTGVTTLVSSNASGAQTAMSIPSSLSFSSTFNSYGYRAVFSAWSSTLSPSSIGQRQQIFAKDLITGAVTLVSSIANNVSSFGIEGNGDSFDPSISANGRYVAFQSYSTNLVAGVTTSEIYLKDLIGPGVVIGAPSSNIYLVSSSANGVAANNTSIGFLPTITQYTSISGDGSSVAFISNATNLIPGVTAGNYEIYVKNPFTGAIMLGSSDSNGNAANGTSVNPAISMDGKRLAFISNATNLVAGTTTSVQRLYVKDLQSGAITLVASGVDPGDLAPSISADGSSVTFSSTATNLVAGATSGAKEVYVWTSTPTGSVTIAAQSTVHLGSAFGGAVKFASNTGTLRLDTSSNFTGTVAGMTGQDAIDFADVNFATVRTPTFSGTSAGGTLHVTDGTHTADITLLGNYLASSFVVSNDGHGGVLVTNPLAPSQGNSLA